MDNTQCESNCYKGICLRTGPNATFECSCNEGWGGENCEYVIGKTCEEDCEKGECVRTDFDTTSCICDPGWTGENCDEREDPNRNNVCMVKDPRDPTAPGLKNTKFCQKNQLYYLNEKNYGTDSYNDGSDFSCTQFQPGWGGDKIPVCDCKVNIRERGVLRSVPTNKYPDGSCMACPPGYYATMERKGYSDVGVVCKKSQNCDKISYEMPQTRLLKTIPGKRTNNKEILGNDTYPDPAQCVPKYMYCGRYGCHVDSKDAQCTFSKNDLKPCPADYGYKTRVEPHFDDMAYSCGVGDNIKRCEYMVKDVRP